MGMTIDEAIEELEWALANNTIEDVESAFKYISAIHMTIETMRKYQKIEEAYKKYLNDMVTNIYADGKFIVALRGILEDGNDD
jgi:predicted nucleic acid-binding Zn finger protein